MYNVLEYRNCPIVRTNGFHTFVHCITQFNYAARVLSIPANGKRKGVVLTVDQKLKMIALRKAGTARAVLMICHTLWQYLNRSLRKSKRMELN